MVKIVKPESKKRSFYQGVCLRCGNRVQYNDEDIESSTYDDDYYYIHTLLCPVCKTYEKMKRLETFVIVED